MPPTIAARLVSTPPRLVKNLVMRSMKRSTPLRSMRQRFAVRPYSSSGGNGSSEPGVPAPAVDARLDLVPATPKEIAD